MREAIDRFRQNLSHVESLDAIYLYLHNKTTEITKLALDEILRAEIVMAVSCLDTYIHDIVRLGIIEIFFGKRLKPQGFNIGAKIFTPILTPIGESMNLHVDLEKALEEFKMLIADSSQNNWLEFKVSELHSGKSFQGSSDIKKALSLITDKDIWGEISKILRIPVKNKLDSIVQRRNQISHASDTDPTDWIKYKQITRYPISHSDASDSVNFIKSLAEELYKILTI